MSLPRTIRQPAKAIVWLVDWLAFPPARGTEDQWLRMVMDEHVTQRLGRLPRHELDAVEVSGDKYRDEGWRSYRSIHWPQHDICDPSLIEPADVIIADQVLEHVPRPWRAIQNMRRLCRDGGLIVVTTPFLVPARAAF
jgi:SAM-dependent methyltransferase